SLVGYYVSLKLKNGREIKGALVEKTATAYRVELPGMGTMDYAVDDVVSVTQVQ
ncbi:MAG: hypothetical protein JO102_04920, partial [Elusimicrobia bacterium]|nr:hypothetical protein [Elusimicrobiota bacterium]